MMVMWWMILETYSTADRFFFLILNHFCLYTRTPLPHSPSSPHNNPQNQNFEKIKKDPGVIMILHKCTIKDNHMIYSSWDMKCIKQFFFVVLGHFLAFCPLTAWKIKISKKWKKSPADMIILHKCSKNHDHMLCYSRDMARDGCNCCFSF